MKWMGIEENETRVGVSLRGDEARNAGGDG